MPAWLENAVFYEIYPQSFYDSNDDGIGDIEGIIEKLPYIKDLGANALWINPCFDSPFMDAGYDVRNYKLVAPRYGTNDDLIRLFHEAHAASIRVLLDLVPGHTSYEHEWFKASAKAAPNEYTNRYIWTDSAWNAPQPYRFVNGMAERDGNFMINFFSSQPALNYGFHEITEPWQLPVTHPDCLATTESMKDVIAFWLDRGCDGFRVDMADSLVKNDDEKIATAGIWRDVRRMLDEKYPEAALVSEWSCPERALKCGFHADFYLDHTGKGYHSLFRKKDRETGMNESFFSREGKGDAAQFASEYSKDYNATKDDGYISFITGNHDTPRLRAFMEPDELKIAYAFLLTMPGVPFLYYGDEIGMRFINGLVSKEGGYSRTGTRTPMQWDRSANMGFSRAKTDELYLPTDAAPDAPDAESEAADPESLLNTVKDLIRLRKSESDLKGNGDFEFLYAKKKKYPLIYRRGGLVMIVNPSGMAAEAPVAVKGSVVFAIGDAPRLDGGRIAAAPLSFVVIRKA